MELQFNADEIAFREEVRAFITDNLTEEMKQGMLRGGYLIRDHVIEWQRILNKKGWHFERQQLPASLHFTLNYIHRLVIDDFIKDLIESVELAKKFSIDSFANNLQTKTVKGLSKILPSGTIAKFKKSGSASPIKKENTAAMYGMLGALSGTDDLEEIVLDFLDKINSVK